MAFGGMDAPGSTKRQTVGGGIGLWCELGDFPLVPEKYCTLFLVNWCVLVHST